MKRARWQPQSDIGDGSKAAARSGRERVDITLAHVLWFFPGYLSGSIPFGLLLAKLAGLGDVRRIGSGNIGATNVLRTGSKKLAALTLLLDALKGFVPVALAMWLAGPLPAALAGAGAFLGHVFPVWLGFRGGKGVATFIGVLFGLHWGLGLAFVGIWLATAVVFRISSLSALTAAAAMPLTAPLLVDDAAVRTVVIVLAIAVFLTHHANIRRLIAGEEPRIGRGGKAGGSTDGAGMDDA